MVHASTYRGTLTNTTVTHSNELHQMELHSENLSVWCALEWVQSYRSLFSQIGGHTQLLSQGYISMLHDFSFQS